MYPIPGMSPKYYESPKPVGWGDALHLINVYEEPHSLNAQPIFTSLVLRCVTPINGFIPGDEIPLATYVNNTDNAAINITANTTTLRICQQNFDWLKRKTGTTIDQYNSKPLKNNFVLVFRALVL